MHSEEKISKILDEKRPTLSRADKDLLWGTIEAKVKTTAPTLSPYAFIFNLKNHMAPLALALILMLGTTGVVAASESARPGDTLFLVDQTVEDIRLALASSDSKTRLEGQFAAERLHELSSILSESIHQTVGTTSVPTVATASSTATSSDFFEPTKEQTRSTISEQDEERVNQAIALTLNYLTRSNISDDTKDMLFAELAFLLEGLPVKLDSEKIRYENDDDTRIRIDTDDKNDGRIEIRDGENRIRIREEDGEIRIETKDDWDDEVYVAPVITTTTPALSITLEAEARVYTDTTIVELEINDRKSTFTTTAKTEAAIVEEIMSRYGLDRELVEDSLDFRIENKASKPPVPVYTAPVDTDTSSSDDDYEEDDREEEDHEEEHEEDHDEEDHEDEREEEDEEEDRSDEDEEDEHEEEHEVEEQG